jgi:hypothetical protein
MINWSNLNFLLYGALGTIALLLLQWIIGLLLPASPPSAFVSLREVARNTASGEYQGDADLYNMDRKLMEAELEHPGSTLRIYFNQPMALLSRFIGSVLLAFTVTGWALGAAQLSCLSAGALLAGLSFLAYPFMTWSMSRPRLKK